MKLQPIKPLRIRIIGVDGSGKSTIQQGLISSLVHDGKRVLKTGPNSPVYGVCDGKEITHFPRFLGGVNHLRKFSEKMGSKFLVSSSAVFQALFAENIIEPRLEKIIKPDVRVGERDFLIDTVAKADVYSKVLSSLSLPLRVQLFSFMTGLDRADVIFFLKTQSDVAFERIQERSRSENNEALQIHEREDLLKLIQESYINIIKILQEKNPILHTYEIDTTKISIEDTIQYTTDKTNDHLSNREPRKIKWNIAI